MLVLLAALALAGTQNGSPGLHGSARNSTAEPYSNTYSLTFDGTGDYVDIGAPADLDGALNAREMTISFWSKRVDTNTRLILTRQHTGATPHFIAAHESPATLSMYVGQGTPNVSTTSPTASAWHHIVARVIDTAGVKKVQFAIDGSLVGSPANAAAGTLTVRWLLSCRWTSSAMSAVDLCWSGKLDEVSFWSVGLSAAEITELYNSGRPGDLAVHSRYAQLLHWYRMGDGDTLPTVRDRKGTSNGTAGGDTALSTDVP